MGKYDDFFAAQADTAVSTLPRPRPAVGAPVAGGPAPRPLPPAPAPPFVAPRLLSRSSRGVSRRRPVLPLAAAAVLLLTGSALHLLRADAPPAAPASGPRALRGLTPLATSAAGPQVARLTAAMGAAGASAPTLEVHGTGRQPMVVVASGNARGDRSVAVFDAALTGLGGDAAIGQRADYPVGGEVVTCADISVGPTRAGYLCAFSARTDGLVWGVRARSVAEVAAVTAEVARSR
jgi:hypothetical protein